MHSLNSKKSKSKIKLSKAKTVREREHEREREINDRFSITWIANFGSQIQMLLKKMWSRQQQMISLNPITDIFVCNKLSGEKNRSSIANLCSIKLNVTAQIYRSEAYFIRSKLIVIIIIIFKHICINHRLKMRLNSKSKEKNTHTFCERHSIFR